MSVTVIAEIGVNHNGSVKLAKEMIDAAVLAGADVVKFQTFKAEKIISRLAPKAEYQKQSTGGGESQLDMVRKLELSESDHYELFEYTESKNIEFMSSPFDTEDIDFLKKLGVKRIKIPSGELVNAPYLFHAAKTKLPLIVSTGMCTLEDIENALQIISYGYSNAQPPQSIRDTKWGRDKTKLLSVVQSNLHLLHCTTEYPAPYSEINLRAMASIKNHFGIPVGYSDHSKGIHVSVAAVALGAQVIEKHFTLDRNLPGPDHQASLEVEELKNMVKCIRDVEISIGDALKNPTESEEKNRVIARKSLVAKRPIGKGEIFTVDNLTSKRPGNGISPLQYWDMLGRVAVKSYNSDDIIDIQETAKQ